MSEISPLLPDQECELEITACLSDGRGLARHNGMAVFVSDALPGERVLATLTKVKPRQASAVCTKKLSPAPDALAPSCAHAGECGGCPWQTMPYPEQLSWKKRFVGDAMLRIAKLDNVPILPIEPSPQIWGYRNKMEFAFAPAAENSSEAGKTPSIDLGLRRRSSHGVVNVTDCRLQSPLTMTLVARARALARELATSEGLDAWDSAARAGFWRFLVVREPVAGGCLVECIVAPHEHARRYGAQMAEALLEAGATGVVLSRRAAWSDVAYGEATLSTYGDVELSESLDGMSLKLGAGAFFQVNTPATELLYAEVARLAALAPIERVWDLYCGVGSIGLYLAQRLPGIELLGIEQTPESIQLASENASALGIHAQWRQGSVEQVLKPGRKALKPAPDLAIVDPPRAGLDPEVITALERLRPPRLLYVSCDPATLARDAARLKSYQPVAVRPVDLFPQTPHVECVALFELK